MPTSLVQNLASRYLGFWYRVSERLRWSRGTLSETACGMLRNLEPRQQAYVSLLQRKYQVCFEAHYTQATSLNNYEYLGLLHDVFEAAGRPIPKRGRVCDVGSANFWYAAALQAFFCPVQLTGVELEGYRLYRDGHSRIDHARGYAGRWPNTEFVVADYAKYTLPADVITCWFPFLTASPVLAWRLPLSILDPVTLWAQIRRNLAPSGLLVMVNHGADEAARAAQLCRGNRLELVGRYRAEPLLRVRPQAPILTLWSGV
jgi:SAM-dependent methyltransferase